MRREFISFLAILLGTVPLVSNASAQPLSTSAADQMQSEFVDVAKRVGPAVVSISTEATEHVRVSRRNFGGSPFSNFDDDLFNRFFRDFMGELPEREFKQRGLGTGVLIDEQGYILTNEHVIHGADKVTVTLPDGREFKGEIKGADIRSDLAVVKIQAKNLPVAELGDSDQVMIGQWAIAIGNPFGFAVGSSEPTVTVGVISAVNRALRLGRDDRNYSNLIQTDAAINPGNSGGPLVNLKGQVIGINVAIFSTTGGYQGIGFAIPINIAKRVVGDLIQGKKILYGWLGINVQDITEDLAKYFGLEAKEGVIVAQVLTDSPAQKAGIKEGDVIRTFDGEKLKDVRDLLNRVGRAPVGKKVKLGILHDKRPMDVQVEIGKRPEESEVEAGKAGEAWRGIKVTAITPDLASRLGLEVREGVVVTEVAPGSPAEEAGLREGDLILGLNQQPVRSVTDFNNLTRSFKGDVLVKTARGYAILRAPSS